jgi:hypothetical protein
MTGIVIPSGREESFPAFSLSVGEPKIMNHFVVKNYFFHLFSRPFVRLVVRFSSLSR